MAQIYMATDLKFDLLECHREPVSGHSVDSPDQRWKPSGSWLRKCVHWPRVTAAGGVVSEFLSVVPFLGVSFLGVIFTKM